jgi:hypothetical protein
MVKSHGHMSKFHPASVMVNIRSRKDHFLKFSPSWFLAKSHVFIFFIRKMICCQRTRGEEERLVIAAWICFLRASGASIRLTWVLVQDYSLL